ncbi:MAG: hypothetical protein K0S70_2107 [Microbacterium sp.]|nr:hypothetical protein [Microbacterium sp.]
MKPPRAPLPPSSGVPPARVGTKLTPRAPAALSAARPTKSAVPTPGASVARSHSRLVPLLKVDRALTNIPGIAWAKTYGRACASMTGCVEVTVIQLDEPSAA